MAAKYAFLDLRFPVVLVSLLAVGSKPLGRAARRPNHQRRATAPPGSLASDLRLRGRLLFTYAGQVRWGLYLPRDRQWGQNDAWTRRQAAPTLHASVWVHAGQMDRGRQVQVILAASGVCDGASSRAQEGNGPTPPPRRAGLVVLGWFLDWLCGNYLRPGEKRHGSTTLTSLDKHRRFRRRALVSRLRAWGGRQAGYCLSARYNVVSRPKLLALGPFTDFATAAWSHRRKGTSP